MIARLPWRPATLVDARPETPTARTLVLDVPGWPGHLAGQHVDVRLTAEDGYRAQRGYSIAGPPRGERGEHVELGVQRLADGEVSPHLVDELAPGDRVEVRGPVGGHFVWRPEDPGPVLLVAGGSGIVPLVAMVRAHRAAGSTVPMRLVASVRTPADVWYADELADPGPGVEVALLFTRLITPDTAREPGRVTGDDLVWPVPGAPTCYVCGPTGFVEAVADLLVGRGHDPSRIRTERFGGA